MYPSDGLVGKASAEAKNKIRTLPGIHFHCIDTTPC